MDYFSFFSFTLSKMISVNSSCIFSMSRPEAMMYCDTVSDFFPEFVPGFFDTICIRYRYQKLYIFGSESVNCASGE